mgnify:CR=1 FL=1
MRLSVRTILAETKVQDIPAKVKEVYGERAYLQRIGNIPCEYCSGMVHDFYWRIAVEGCERCDTNDVHDSEHFRCNHGAHCTRDWCF